MQREIIFKIDWTPNGFVSIGAESVNIYLIEKIHYLTSIL